MGSITIEIKRSDVYDEVGRMSAYLGQRRSTAEDASAFDRIGLTGSDEGLLDGYLAEAVSVLCLRLQRYLVSKEDADKGTEDAAQAKAVESTEDEKGDEKGDADGGDEKGDGGVKLELTVSSRFNKGMAATLPDSVRGYLSSYILQRWCSVSSPDDEKYYAGLAVGFMADVIGKVCSKTRPTRKPVDKTDKQ